MGIRRSFVDWNKFTGEEKLESGKTYLVFSVTDGTKGKPVFAVYYKKGDVVRPALRKDYALHGAPDTPEERLLEAIFGRTRACVIPYDGFYVMTGDYGIDDGFEGCSEMPVCFGNAVVDDPKEACPCFWAEAPLEPAGFEPVGAGSLPDIRDEKILARYDELNARLEADEMLRAAFDGLCGYHAAVDGKSFERPLGPCTYELSTSKAAERVVRIADCCRALSGIDEDEVTRFAIEMRKLDSETATKSMADFLDRHGMSHLLAGYTMQYLMARSAEAGDYDLPNFYWFRDKILRRGGSRSLDTPAVMQEALGHSRVPMRIARIVKLLRLGAPDVIIQNEVRVCAETECMFRDAGRIVSVDADAFADTYGIWPDGSRREGKACHVGDAELVALDPEAENPWAPGDGPRYIWAFSPNFLMRKSGAPILDREERAYLKDDDGQIRLFEDEPVDELAKLNGGTA